MARASASTTGTAFVTVTAKVSIVIGVLATLYAVLQWIMALLLPTDLVPVVLFGTTGNLPASLAWTLRHLEGLATAFLVVSALFLVASWGLLRRRRWGWWGFAGFMVLGAVANFAAIAAVDTVFEWLRALPSTPELDALRQTLEGLRTLSLALMWGTALVFAVLHGLVIRHMAQPSIRAEFWPSRPPR